MKQKSFRTELEFISDLPQAPGAGELQLYQRSATRVLGSLMNSGWSFQGTPQVKPTDVAGRYKLSFALRRRGQRRFDLEAAQAKSQDIAERLLQRLPGWRKDGQPTIAGMDDDSKELTIDELLSPIGDKDIINNFSHIYDRDVQIKEILESIRLARATDMKVRHHVLLYGSPGAGKTEILLTLSAIFGDIACKRLDATATTKAGAERMILDAPVVPPLILIEEGEKVNEANLPWMLSVLDSRGEIIKTTARMDVRRLAKCLVIMTVNDLDKFRNFHYGALYDRFSLPLYCPIPDRNLIRRVLLRELESIPDGDPAWIDPAIEYALEHEHTHQIRRIKAVMAIGRERLLDGSYQREHDAIRCRKNEDESIQTKANLEQ